MQYKEQHIDFEFIMHFFMTEKEEQKRVHFLNFLKANRALIEDDTIIGLLLYLDKHNWDHQKLEEKLTTLTYPFQKHRKTVKHKTNYLKYVASIIIIAASILSILYLTDPPLSKYFPVETGLPNLMSSYSTQDNKWEKLNTAFQHEDYEFVYITCKELIANKMHSDTLYYFSGIAAYKLKKYEEAASYFNQIEQYKKSVFLIDSEYLLALSLMSTKEKKQGKEILKSMSNDPNHPYSLQAKELIKRK